MTEWNKIRIGDVVNINESSISEDFEFTVIEYIDTSSVEKGKLINTQIIPLKEAPSRARRLVKKNDILISSVRPNLEHYYFVHDYKANTIVSTGFIVISPKENVVPYFLYCLLTTPRYTKYLTQIANSHTSTFPSFNPDIIEDSTLEMPTDLEEQQEISRVFYNIDQKIDLLHRQSETLESIAQALFKHWFVDFEFPDENSQPYKSSGGIMMPSKEYGELPAGWRVIRINDLIDVRDGTHDSPKQANEGFPLITSKHLVNGQIDFNSAYLISRSDFDEINKRSKVDRFDILVSMIGTVGILYFVLEEKTEFAIKNVGLFKTSCNQLIAEYVYLLLNSMYGKKYFLTRMTGTTQSYITLGSLREMPILDPGIQVIERFNKIVNPVFLKIHTNSISIERLIQIRDTLLPKLISGQIRVTV